MLLKNATKEGEGDTVAGALPLGASDEFATAIAAEAVALSIVMLPSDVPI